MSMVTKLHNMAQGINIDPDRINVPKEGLGENTVTSGLQVFFGIAAAVAVLIIAISALRMVLSRGNPQDFQKARDAVIYAVVGLVITMSGFAIVTFVINRV